jgi:hypothetical protein
VQRRDGPSAWLHGIIDGGSSGVDVDRGQRA